MPRQTYTGVGLDPFIRYAYTQQRTKREEEGENGKHKNERGKRKFFPRSRNDSSCRPMYAQRIFAGHTLRTRRTHSKTLSFLPPLILNLWRTLLFSSPARTASSASFSLSPSSWRKDCRSFFTPFILCPLCSALSACLGKDAREQHNTRELVLCGLATHSHFSLVRGTALSFSPCPVRLILPLALVFVLHPAFGDVLFRDREKNFSFYTFPFNKFINQFTLVARIELTATCHDLTFSN